MNPIYTILRPFILPLVIALVASGAVTGAYFYAKHKGYAQCEADTKAEAALAAAAQVKEAQDKALALEAELEKQRKRADQLNESLNDEIANRPVYRECHVPADGVQLLQRALAATGPR